MRNTKLTLLLAMLVLAIFAVGAVSAEDNVTDIDVPTEDTAIDEVAVDDDSAGETDEIEETEQTRTITYTPYYIDTSSDFDGINYNITNGIFDGYEFIFDNTTDYTNFAMVTGNNNEFTGNGATIIGSTDNLFTVAGSNNIVITGFNMNVATGKAAIYGANVFNAEITHNIISGGKDGINIMKSYDNVIITDNTITGFTRDGISLVDNRQLDDLSIKNDSIISNNIITGISASNTEIGIFLGGNFKGNISNNHISYSEYAIQFLGKPTGNISKIMANILYNSIDNVAAGIYMINETAISLNITGNIIATNHYFNNFTINYGENFSNATSDSINLYHNTLSGAIKRSFINMVDQFENWFDGYIWEDVV